VFSTPAKTPGVSPANRDLE
jgi:hypothetical protein